MERFDSAFQDSIFVFIADHDPLFPATLSYLSLYMIIYVDWIYAIVSKLWLFDKRRTLLTRLYLVVEKSGEKCVHVYETYNGRKLVSQQNLSISWSWNSRKNIINSMSNRERRRMIHRETWICIRVYRNIHLIVMDQLSKGDLLFLWIRRETLHYPIIFILFSHS